MKRLAVEQHPGKDGKFFLLQNDTGVSRAIRAIGRYQHTILKQCLKELRKGDTVLDIGSNIGSFTISFAKAVGNTGTVHAFEPQRVIFQMLCANVILNGLPNVFTHHAGLSDNDRSGHIGSKVGNAYTYFDRIPFTHCMVSDGVGEAIELKRLDSFHLPAIALMKVDVESHELHCLRGATETIERCRPIIVVETYKNTEKQRQLTEQINEFMEEANYHAEPIVRPNGESRDTLFRPREKCA